MSDIAAAEQKFINFREELNAFRGDLKEYYGFFVQQCELILKGMQDNQMFNNKENNEIRTKMTMQGHEIRLLKDECKENAIRINTNNTTLDRLQSDLSQSKSSLDKKISLMTPLKDFKLYTNDTEENSRRLKYSCKDLDNKIKTTDRYID